MKNNKLHKLILLIFICGIMFISGCTQPSEQAPADTVTIKLNWKDSVQFLGFYVAQHQGFYAEENLDITLVPIEDTFETDGSLEKVGAGEFDFGIAATSVILRYQDQPITMVAALYQFSPATLFARAELGINSPADLAGHSVAVKSNTWNLLIDEILVLSNISPDKVTKVKTGFDMTPFYEGDVDVWVGWITNEVVRARLKGLDIVTLPFYEYGIENTDNMIYTSQDMVENNPEMIDRVLRATLKGWEWAVANPVEAVDIFIEFFPEFEEDRDFHQGSFESSIPLIIPPGKELGSLNCQMSMLSNANIDEALCNNTFLQNILNNK